MIDTLAYIGNKLNKEGVIWGVGASILLKHYGLIERPNDIDILVDIKDIQKVDIVLKRIGEKLKCKETSTYATEYFYEYTVNGFDVDVMAGLRINSDNVIFNYFFDKSSITEIIKINEVDIPLTSLEDWYVIYQLIPNRKSKVKKIENYLLSNGIQHPKLLERALGGNLPNEVRDKIQWIIKLCERNK